MLEFEISAEQYKRGRELYNFYNIKDSITKGESQIYGAMGEVVVSDYLGIPLKNTKDYDIVIGSMTFDVKTKKTTVKPQPHYLASTADTSIHQDCGGYIFCRVSANFDKCWVMGVTSSKTFYKTSSFDLKGSVDPSSDRGWTFKADSYNLPYSELNCLSTIKKVLGGNKEG